jgi:holliday junction DNA helicase RuvB
MKIPNVLISNPRIREAFEGLLKVIKRGDAGTHIPQKTHMTSGLDVIVGQWRVKEIVRRSVRSCKARGATFPHTLLSGLGGLGKTAIARAIAQELGYHFEEIEAAALKTRQNVIDILKSSTETASSKRKPLLLFVDEIHNLTRKMQEALYFPMVEFRITTLEDNKGEEIKFPPFTLVGATTLRDELEYSFEGRFDLDLEIDLYSEEHLMQILSNFFLSEDIRCGVAELRMIAQRCLGIPRRAVSFGKKVRDEILSRGGEKTVSRHDIYNTFALEGIDSIGLGPLHVKYLQLLLAAQPNAVGISAISGQLGRQEDVVRGTVEPILLRLGLISCTPRGRVITDSGYKHLASSGLA